MRDELSRIERMYGSVAEYNRCKEEVEEEIETQCQCPYGGDENNDCKDCAESGDYHFINGECIERPKYEIILKNKNVTDSITMNLEQVSNFFSNEEDLIHTCKLMIFGKINSFTYNIYPTGIWEISINRNPPL